MSPHHIRRSCQAFLIGMSFASPSLLRAQSDLAWQPLPVAPSLQPVHLATERVSRPQTRIGLAHVGITAGVLVVATLADRPTRDFLQRHRTSGKDDVARIFKDMGEPDIYAPLPLALIATGLISGNDRILRSGGRIAASLLTAGAVTNLLKPIGRVRPKFADNAYEFTPLRGSYAWPSGHSTEAFALATSVSDEIHFLPASIALYSAATLTGWSRLNDNRHWVTDVLGGMLVGITSAKVMNGRWRFLGIGGPRFLQEPRSTATDSTTGAGMRLRPERRLLGVGNARLLLSPGLAGMQFDF